MMRSTRLQLRAASWNCAKRRTLPRAGAVVKRSAVVFSSASTWRFSAALGASPSTQSTRFSRHQSKTSGAGVVRIGAQQDLDPGPMGAQGADEATQKGADLM